MSETRFLSPPEKHVSIELPTNNDTTGKTPQLLLTRAFHTFIRDARTRGECVWMLDQVRGGGARQGAAAVTEPHCSSCALRRRNRWMHALVSLLLGGAPGDGGCGCALRSREFCVGECLWMISPCIWLQGACVVEDVFRAAHLHRPRPPELLSVQNLGHFTCSRVTDPTREAAAPNQQVHAHSQGAVARHCGKRRDPLSGVEAVVELVLDPVEEVERLRRRPPSLSGG
ncbi:unnamed protein product [Pleuronectes platessa]|uniref:Uncharacterized protein n=1 Tax=Pleuronectes platessa TaxID=8262 RepID=A0A9N7TLG8_PLEPL|nr:unnamed protein product [Pleuronectes platessa]